MSDAAGDTKRITLHVPIESIFEAFTIPSKLAAWSPLRADISAQLGGTYTLSTPDGKVHTGTIETFATPEQLAVRWPDWNLNLRLRPQLGGTEVTIQTEAQAPWHDCLDALQSYFRRPIVP